MVLLSTPQCHAALGRMPDTLAWVDHSTVSRLYMLPLPTIRMVGDGLWSSLLQLTEEL